LFGTWDPAPQGALNHVGQRPGTEGRIDMLEPSQVIDAHTPRAVPQGRYLTNLADELQRLRRETDETDAPTPSPAKRCASCSPNA